MNPCFRVFVRVTRAAPPVKAVLFLITLEVPIKFIKLDSWVEIAPPDPAILEENEQSSIDASDSIMLRAPPNAPGKDSGLEDAALLNSNVVLTITISVLDSKELQFEHSSALARLNIIN